MLKENVTKAHKFARPFHETLQSGGSSRHRGVCVPCLSATREEH